MNFFLSQVTLISQGVNLIKHFVPTFSSSAGWFYCIANLFICSSVLKWDSCIHFLIVIFSPFNVPVPFASQVPPKFQVVKREVGTVSGYQKHSCSSLNKTSFKKCVFQFNRCCCRCRKNDRQCSKACITTDRSPGVYLMYLTRYFTVLNQREIPWKGEEFQ